jgi:Pyruvate/2-oxoacid:ferredoxin oxidoreductase gamma subunit
VSTAIRERFPASIADANVAAAIRAFEIVRAEVEEYWYA